MLAPPTHTNQREHPLPTHSPISSEANPRSSLTEAVLSEAAQQLQAEVEKKADALKQREKMVEEKEVDLQDKFARIREKEEELARRDSLLKEQYDTVSKQLEQVMEKESHIEVSRVEMMEETAALEDRERKMKESEIAATAAATAAAQQLQASRMQLEADKQQLNVDKARLNAERNDFTQKQEAAAATLVPLDQPCNDDEVQVYKSILIEQTHQHEVRFSSEDAEELHAKVTAQKQYKESVDVDREDLDIGLAGGLLELQDDVDFQPLELQEDVDFQPNAQESIVVTKSTPISSKKPKEKNRLKKKATSKKATKSDIIHLKSQLSPSHQKNMEIGDRRMIARRSKRVFFQTKK